MFQNNDTIYKQAAIDAMCDACSDWCDEGVCKKVLAIQKLPSAQLEIILCKSCRYNNDCEIQYAAQAGSKFFCGAAKRREK